MGILEIWPIFLGSFWLAGFVLGIIVAEPRPALVLVTIMWLLIFLFSPIPPGDEGNILRILQLTATLLLILGGKIGMAIKSSFQKQK